MESSSGKLILNTPVRLVYESPKQKNMRKVGQTISIDFLIFYQLKAGLKHCSTMNKM